MSTSAQISPTWKQEVNRRLAEHRGRRGPSAAEPQARAETQHNASRRAMEAAARVAARYANAPSYSEVLASEARAALRAAEAASRAALHAQAAAQSVLDGIEAASAAELAAASLAEPMLQLVPEPGSGPVAEPVPDPVIEMRIGSAPVPGPVPVSDGSPFAGDFADDFLDSPIASRPDPRHEPHQDARLQSRVDPQLDPWPERVRAELSAAPAPVPAPAAAQPIAIRWDAELPVHPHEPVQARAARGRDPFATGAEDWWRPAALEPERAEPEQIEIVEPLPIPANLIEFPRELVAARKARPRLAEGPAAPEAGAQLSIFEVDPISISTEPAVELPAEPAQSWTVPVWSGLELEAHPAQQVEEAIAEPTPLPEAAPALQPAPATLRLMALVVDGALIAGSLVSAALVAASRARTLPGPRATEIGIAVALLLATVLYEALFFTLGRTTPGMKYAQIRLSTFEGHMPARAQRCKRLVALLISVLPVGLGLAWALFDENHLSWHDRRSRTYLCKR